MLAGIPDAREVVLSRTGHVFRFTHPDQYGAAITEFIDEHTPHTCPAVRQGTPRTTELSGDRTHSKWS